MYNIERLGKALLLILYLKKQRDPILLRHEIKTYYNAMKNLKAFAQKLSQQLYKANRKLLIYEESNEVFIKILYKNKIQKS
jgi:hypothetical protein